MQDIPAIAKAAKARGATVMMDNTWATPIHFRPLEHGVDISIHAATKYPAGHSDVLLGTVSANEALLGAIARDPYHHGLLRGARRRLPGAARPAHHGGAAGAPRGERAGTGALAGGAAGRGARAAPGLESFPGHAIWKRDFSGASGIFSIVLAGGGKPAAHAFLDALEIFGLGYSWGGYESLAVHASLATGRWPARRRKAPSCGCRSGWRTSPI
jgi:cysteine-S-conjugate beta-lyase